MGNGSCIWFKNFGFLILIFGLQVLYVNTDQYPGLDTLETRLEELPKRLHQLADIAFPDGIPESFFTYYTLPFAPSEICRNQSAEYKDAFKRFEPWAVRMIDSSGKVPSGVMQAHFHDLGHFHECLNVGLENKSPYPVQHCVLQIGNIINLPKSKVVDLENLDTVLGGLPILKPRLHLGLCLPASCTLDDLRANYKQIVNKYNLTVHFDKYSCTASNEEKPLGTLDYVVLIVICVPLIVGIIATFLEMKFPCKDKPGRMRQSLECFSFYQNGRLLVKTDSPKRPLSSLNAIRFLSVSWIIIAHHWLFSAIRPALNYIEMSQLFTKVYAAAILNGVLAVDTFILLNGLLLSYLFLDVTNKGHKFNLILFYLHRVVRILPGYVLQILLALTYYPRIFSNGPLWKTYIHRHTENCMKSWWTNVLFINNYVNVDSQCIQSSWYLSVDMQLHVISPIFLFALYKYKSFIKFGIPICIVIANTIAFSNSYINQFPAGSIISRDFKTVHKYPHEYITTHTKLGPWFVGLGLGYILYHLEGKRLKISPLLVKLCWVASVVVGGAVLMTIVYFHRDDIPYNRVLSSSYTGFHSTLWALCISWVIFACETGHGGPVWRFLTWRTFQPLGKVSFVLYLAHVALQYGTSSGRKISGYMEIFPMVRDIFGEIFLCILMSPFLSIVYEAPFIRLEKFFLNTFVLPRSKVKTDTKDVKDQDESLIKYNGEKIVITNGSNGVNGDRNTVISTNC